MNTTNLRDMATAMGIMKKAQAAVTDGTIIGISTVSGGPYTGELLSVGSVVQLQAGPALLVDAIAYGDHYAVHNDPSATFYKGENRFIAIVFDPKTLKFTGKRSNVGFKSVTKAQNLGTIWAYVKAFDDNAAAVKAASAARDARAAEARASRARVAKSTIQESILNSFL